MNATSARRGLIVELDQTSAGTRDTGSHHRPWKIWLERWSVVCDQKDVNRILSMYQRDMTPIPVWQRDQPSDFHLSPKIPGVISKGKKRSHSRYVTTNLPGDIFQKRAISIPSPPSCPFKASLPVSSAWCTIWRAGFVWEAE